MLEERKDYFVLGQGGMLLGWPISVGVSLALLVALLWWSLEQYERDNMKHSIQVETNFLALHIEDDMQHRVTFLNSMERRWGIRGSMSAEEFASDAYAYFANARGAHALEWADTNYVIRWAVPLAGNEKVIGVDLSSDKKRRPFWDMARVNREPVMTGALELVQGGIGVVINLPIYSGDQFKGFILAILRPQEWLNQVFDSQGHRGLRENFQCKVYMDGRLIYKQNANSHGVAQEWSASAESKVLGHRFIVQLMPTQDYLKNERSSVPYLAALLGVLLSLLIASIVYLLLKMVLQMRRSGYAKLALQDAVKRHARAEKELQFTLARLAIATEAGGIGVWSLEAESLVLSWDERMYRLFDIPSDAPATLEIWHRVIHSEDYPRVAALLKQALEGGAVFDTAFRVLWGNGSEHTLRAAAKVERDSAGSPQRIVGVNWDITDLKQAEAAAHKSEARVHLLLNSTAEAIYGIDLQGNCTFVNSSCVRVLGYSDAQQLLGKNMHWLIHHSYGDGSRMPLEDCRIYKAFHAGTGMHVDDEVLWKADGSCFPAEYWSYPQIDNGQITGAVVTFNDVSERKKVEEQILHLATHDTLTDLPSLRLVKDRLAMAMGQAHRHKTMAALMFIDLDAFKSVNDTLGHEAGDQVLKLVGKQLLSCVREIDTVARIGGDEFLLIATDLNVIEDVVRIAMNIIRLISEPMSVNGKLVQIGASIGIALYPKHGENPDDLIKRADEAMYDVKKTGKNGYRIVNMP